MNNSTKEISQAIMCWNRLFEWTAKKCDNEEEGMKILFLLNKILKPLKKHSEYNNIDLEYGHNELLKEMEDYKKLNSLQ